MNDKIAIIVPYEYFVWGKTKRVWVDKDDTHPDPSKLLTWGYDDCAELVPGDYNRQFTRLGKPVNISYSIRGAMGAGDEKKRKIKAIEEYILALHACNKNDG